MLRGLQVRPKTSPNPIFRANVAPNRFVSNKIHQFLSAELKKQQSARTPLFAVSTITNNEVVNGKKQIIQRHFEMFKQGFEKPMAAKYQPISEMRNNDKERRELLEYYNPEVEKRFPELEKPIYFPSKSSQLLLNTLRDSREEDEENYVKPIQKLAEAEKKGYFRNPKESPLSSNSSSPYSEDQVEKIVSQIEETYAQLEERRRREERVKDQANELDRTTSLFQPDNQFSKQQKAQINSKLSNPTFIQQLKKLYDELIQNLKTKNEGNLISIDLLSTASLNLENHFQHFSENMNVVINESESDDSSNISTQQLIESQDEFLARESESYHIDQARNFNPQSEILTPEEERKRRLEDISQLLDEGLYLSNYKNYDSLSNEFRELNQSLYTSSDSLLIPSKSYQEFVVQGESQAAEPVLSWVHYNFNVLQARDKARELNDEKLKQLLFDLRATQIKDSDSGQVEHNLYSALKMPSPFPEGEFTPGLKKEIKRDRKGEKLRRKEEIENRWPLLIELNPYQVTMEDILNPANVLPTLTAEEEALQKIRFPFPLEPNSAFPDVKNLEKYAAPMEEEDDVQGLFEDDLLEEDDEPAILDDEEWMGAPDNVKEDDASDEFSETKRSDADDDGEELLTVMEEYALREMGEPLLTMKDLVKRAYVIPEVYADQGWDPITAQLGLNNAQLREMTKEELTDFGIELKGEEAEADNQLREQMDQLHNELLNQVDEEAEVTFQKMTALVNEHTERKKAAEIQFPDLKMEVSKAHHSYSDEYAASIPVVEKENFSDTGSQDDDYDEKVITEYDQNAADEQKRDAPKTIYSPKRTQTQDPYFNLRLEKQSEAIPFGEENPVRIAYVEEMPFVFSQERWVLLRQRKVRLELYVPALKLSAPALERFNQLSEGRVKNNVLRIIVDRHPKKVDNAHFAKRIAQKLIEESWKADPAYVSFSNAESYKDEQAFIDLDQLFFPKYRKDDLKVFHLSN